MPDTIRSQSPKLLDEVRNVLRLHHYSIHTERSYVDWIVRFVRFHAMRAREDLFSAEPKIETFYVNEGTLPFFQFAERLPLLPSTRPAKNPLPLWRLHFLDPRRNGLRL